MNKDIVILTDSASDLPLWYIEENNIATLGLICNFKGEGREDDFGKTFTYNEFYNGIRAGEMPTTSQINVYRFTEIFRKHAKEGKAVIYIGISSALSGCVSSAYIARETVMEELEGADITVIDSKGASLGEGILVYRACEMLKQGYSKEEIVKWLEENKLKSNHWFIVNDLSHLKRGGRVSASAAAIGSLLHINPLMFVNEEGKLTPFTNVRGRKKAIKSLADKFKENVDTSEPIVVGISHGDCLEEAQYLEALIKQETNIDKVLLNYVGPVIGSHTGPGVLTIFFFGTKR